MKKVCIMLICAMALALLAGCSAASLPRPETDLEFWIGENADGADLSRYVQKKGLMGGREFYGSGYVPSEDENGAQTDPPECVIYTVTAFPDYSSGSQHVTRISITDPKVGFYGITLRSSADAIKAAMEKNGFRLKDDRGADGTVYVNGKYSVVFTASSIVLSVEVTNNTGIVF